MKFKLKDYKPNEAIKIIREWSGLSQKEFAKTINRSKDTVQSWELGRTIPSFATIYEIAKKYNLDITVEKKRK